MANGPDESDENSSQERTIRTPMDTQRSGAGASSRDLSGQVLGDFAVQRRLGSGGMGEVYLAEQISLKRPVAVKVLHEELMADEAYRRRFEAEAMAVAPINHPNIVSVISIGKQNDVHYIAMEYVPGMNLREYVARKGPADPTTGLSIMRKVTAALDQAAQHGIVHRDIKPDNILLTKKGDVKVADFGLARQTTAKQVDLTQSGVTMGTPLYMSPEQLEGKPVDTRSDLYSFGILCYHLFAGEPPYRGETALSIAVQHLKSDIPSLAERRPDLPPELIGIIEKMMAKKPADRFQTPKELLRELSRVKQRIHPSAMTVGELSVAYPVKSSTIAMTDEMPAVALSSQAGTTTHAWLPSTWSRGVRLSVLIWGLLLASGAGAFFGWSQREQAMPGVSQAVLAEQIEDAAKGIKPRKDGWIQLLEARTVLPEDEREAGLWAVLTNFKHQEDPVIEAAQELVERYLPRGDYDSALVLANKLIACDDPKEKMFGYLVQGIVRSRQGQPEESNQSFLDMMECSEPAKSFEPTQLQWLATQYFLALNLNAQMLGTKPEQRMIDNFWSQFLPKRGPGGPPGRPPGSDRRPPPPPA